MDPEGPGGPLTLFESGAILKYVGEKANNGLYPRDPARRVVVDQWLFYGSATFTTLAQQFGFFHLRCPKEVPVAKSHYLTIMRDMFATLDNKLAETEYVAGEHSVADIAFYADVHIYGPEAIGLADYPNLKRWHDTLEAGPALQKSMGSALNSWQFSCVPGSRVRALRSAWAVLGRRI